MSSAFCKLVAKDRLETQSAESSLAETSECLSSRAPLPDFLLLHTWQAGFVASWQKSIVALLHPLLLKRFCVARLQFVLDEESLPVGAALHTALVEQYLKSQSELRSGGHRQEL